MPAPAETMQTPIKDDDHSRLFRIQDKAKERSQRACEKELIPS
jgi:hypothetical protein